MKKKDEKYRLLFEINRFDFIRLSDSKRYSISFDK